VSADRGQAPTALVTFRISANRFWRNAVRNAYERELTGGFFSLVGIDQPAFPTLRGGSRRCFTTMREVAISAGCAGFAGGLRRAGRRLVQWSYRPALRREPSERADRCTPHGSAIRSARRHGQSADSRCSSVGIGHVETVFLNEARCWPIRGGRRNCRRYRTPGQVPRELPEQDRATGRHSAPCTQFAASIHRAVSSDRSSSRVTGQISGVGNGACPSIVSGSPRRASR
jgi:hypothetical protein